jgi:hypothetical protein
MPEHDARRRAVYDHAEEDSRPAGRSRRTGADDARPGGRNHGQVAGQDPRVVARSHHQVADDTRTGSRSHRQVADDEPRPVGRSRRPVADWGVGEELFDGMPGHRRERRGADHGPARDGSVPLGGASDGRRTIVITDDDVGFEDEPPAPGEFASRDDALEARRRHDEIWGGDEPFADAPVAAAHLDRYAEAVEAFGPGGRFAEEPPTKPAEPDGIVRGGVEGRRTVKIGGRPAEFHPTPRRSRTVHERLGPRPDRIAAWAFALGILLILIAVATANI